MSIQGRTEKKLVVAIIGPTSSGKSDFAIRLAREFNGEIISADSRQVYKGLDLGTRSSLLTFGIPSSILLVLDKNNQFCPLEVP